MKLTILSILTLLSSGLLFADGLPLNEARTMYKGPHQLVKLNADQLEEVTVARTLTLTREQWREARSHAPDTPKRIDTILPCTYNDCTCGMENSVFGIWFKDGTVAIVSYEERKPFVQLDEGEKKRIATEIRLNMDDRGQFYESGKLVPYDEVKARVGHACPPKANNDYSGDPLIGIEIPPTSKASDAALASRLAELQKIAKSVGRDFYVFWDMTGLSEE
jgi:hypothetical protein